MQLSIKQKLILKITSSRKTQDAQFMNDLYDERNQKADVKVDDKDLKIFSKRRKLTLRKTKRNNEVKSLGFGPSFLSPLSVVISRFGK